MLNKNFGKNNLGLNFAMPVFAMMGVSLLVSFVVQLFSIPTDNYFVQVVSTAINTLAIGSMAFVCAAATRTNPVTATKLNAKPPIAHIGWGCLATLFLIAFMVPLNSWISELIVLMGLPAPSVSIDMDIVSMIVFVCVLPAFCEEVVFRGAIAGSMENNKNKLASLAIAGALFSVFHTNPAQTVHQFALGAFLALLYYRSGSLWTTVIVHFFNNALVVALDAIFGERLDVFFANNAIWLFFVGLICFAGAVVGYLFTTKSKWQTESGDEEEPKYNASCKILLFTSAGICLVIWILVLFLGAG